MKVQTNTTVRKILADELSRLIGEPYKYLGAPSMAFKIGPYTLSRDGSLEGDDFTAVRDFLIENNYVSPDALSVTADHDSAEDAGSTLDDVDQLAVSIPLRDYTANRLSILLKVLYNRQVLINAMTQSDSVLIDVELMARLRDEQPATVEAIEKLLREEIEAEQVRGVAIEDGRIIMQFPFDANEPAKWQSYAALMMAIDKSCKDAKFVNVKKMVPGDGEMKHRCYTWLNQLGFGGKDHKEARRILTGHLEGYAAFLNRGQMKEHSRAVTDRRRLQRETERMGAIEEVFSDD